MDALIRLAHRAQRESLACRKCVSCNLRRRILLIRLAQSDNNHRPFAADEQSERGLLTRPRPRGQRNSYFRV